MCSRLCFVKTVFLVIDCAVSYQSWGINNDRKSHKQHTGGTPNRDKIILPGRCNVKWPCWMTICAVLSGTETEPQSPGQGGDEATHEKFVVWRDKALATIVIAADPSLLYLICDPENPKDVWQKLHEQFQKKRPFFPFQWQVPLSASAMILPHLPRHLVLCCTANHCKQSTRLTL